MGRLASFSDALQLDSEELASIPTGPTEVSETANAAEEATVVDANTVGEGASAIEGEITPVADNPPVESDEAEPATLSKPPEPEKRASTASASRKIRSVEEKKAATTSVLAPERTLATANKTPAPTPEPEPAPSNDKARWTQLQRKEFRMHNVQADSLATLTRKVNRMSPRDPEERVTDNTLIRVGLALLLELHKDDLRGKNERELRESVGLPPELPNEE
jgi:hypothetical protein